MTRFSLRSLFRKKPSTNDDILYIPLIETDSTNHYLKNYSSSVSDGKSKNRLTIAYADYQTAGRGQGTNTWESANGKNLLFSILCHPSWVPIQSQFIISEAIALAIHDALSAITNDITIKWPNDIYWQNRKISGTLIESTIEARHIKDCIIGTGVNVNQTAFESDAPNPVSLYQITGHETDRLLLLHDIANRFSNYLTDIRNGNYEKIVSLYMSYLYRSHGFFPYRDKNGLFEGAIVEVEDDGHLVLRDKGDHIRSYAFKEVSFEK